MKDLTPLDLGYQHFDGAEICQMTEIKGLIDLKGRCEDFTIICTVFYPKPEALRQTKSELSAAAMPRALGRI